jgi:5-(carboxyamino)imidazole ribonucleotide mutase
MTGAKVAILMGSASDLVTMAEAAKELRGLDVPFELEVTSAHRTPARTAEYVHDAVRRGVQVFIVGAGMAAHLAGAVAANTTRPVIGVPLEGSPIGGLDSLLSTVQMPRGIPVATLAIGKAGAANAGLLAAQMLALSDPELAARLAAQREAQAKKVMESSSEAQRRLGELL